MMMKQFATTFLAILFAGYGMAVPFDVLLNTTQNLTISEEGSSTTTAEPSLPFDNVSVYCREGIALNETLTRVKEDFYKLDIKVRDFASRMNKILKTFNYDKGRVKLKNYVPSAGMKLECYCEERTCESFFNRGRLGHCTYNYNCTYGFAPTTGRQISDCHDPPTAERCSEFTDLRKNSTIHFILFVIHINRSTVESMRYIVEYLNGYIRSTDSSSEYFSRRHCRDPTNTLLSSEVAELSERELNAYKYRVEVISRSVINIDAEIDEIDGSVQILAESATIKMNDATKKWACCMERLYSYVRVKGIDCEGSRRFDKPLIRNRSEKVGEPLN